MKRMKRWISLVLALSMMLSVCPVSVYAETVETEAAVPEMAAVTEAVTEPLEITEATEPVQTTAPAETTEATEPEQTTVPTEPPETTEATEPVEETTEATEPEQTTEATEPVESTEATEPAETTVIQETVEITVSQEAAMAATTVASGTCGENLTWVLDKEGVLTLSGTGKTADYVMEESPWYSYRNQIISVVVERGITHLGTNLFYFCDSITSVSLPEDLVSIDFGVFAACQKLKKITLPESLETIGWSVFMYCTALEEVELQDGLKRIDNSAFAFCTSLKDIALPDGLEKIGGGAFEYSGLVSISIPVSLKTVVKNAFNGCGSLTDVYYNGLEEQWSQLSIESGNDCLLSADLHCNTGIPETNCFSSFVLDMPYLPAEHAKVFLSFIGDYETQQDSVIDNKFYKIMTGDVSVYNGDLMALKADILAMSYFIRAQNASKIESKIKASRDAAAATVAYAMTFAPSSGQISDAELGILAEYKGNAEDKLMGGIIDFVNEAMFYGRFGNSIAVAIDNIGMAMSSFNAINSAVETASNLINGVMSAVYGLKYACDNQYNSAYNYFETYITHRPDYDSKKNAAFQSILSLQLGLIELNASYFDPMLRLCGVADWKEAIVHLDYWGEYLCDLERYVNVTSLSSAEIEHLWDVTLHAVNEQGDVFVETICSTCGTKKIEKIPAHSHIWSDDWKYNDTHHWHTCKNLGCTIYEISQNEGYENHNFENGSCKCGARDNTCGDDLTWILDDAGTLTISGTGDMDDFADGTSMPWYDHLSSITSVVLEDGVTEIGSYAFDGCTALVSVTIPASVRYIDYRAFAGCTALTSVTIPEGTRSIGNAAFEECTALTSIVIPASVTSIGNYAFYKCGSLTGVTIPEGMTSINQCVFGDCSSLTGVTIPEGVTVIEQFAFSGCTSLTGMTIPDSVTLIEQYAFSDCAGLTELTFGNGITSIGNSAFKECTGLTNVTIPDSVTSIDHGAFSGCTGLTSVRLPNGVTSIRNFVFSQCTNLTAVTIPDSVTGIGDSAFKECTGLTEITIPAGVTDIDRYALAGCTGLNRITFEGDAPTFGIQVFSSVTATACYPAGNDTWTEDKLQNYGGTITWEPRGVCEDGHTEVIDEAVAATCTESGLTEGSHCSVCGVTLAAQEVTKPAGHRYEAVYTAPTFDADGFTTYTCSACGDAYTETDEGTMKSAAASIGSVKYETLAEAFAAAKEGDTILMLKTYTIAKGTSETWDLSGKTLEISGNRGGIRVEGNLTVLGGTFRFLEGAQGLMVWENGQVTIEDGTFHTVDSRGIWAVYGKVTFNGGTFYVTGDGYIGTSERRAGSNEFAQFVINGGTFYFRDSGHFADYGNSTIKGGTFYLESRGGTIRADYSYHRDSLTITGGTFYISGAVGFWVDPAKGHLIIKDGTFITIADGAQILEYDGGTLGIYGGTFSQDMTPYLSNNYCCRKSGAYYVVGSHLYNLKNTSEAYLKTEAGCTNPAEYYKSCACGKAGTDTFTHGDPLGHSFTNYVSNNNATCTENGTETASCNRACGTTDEREIPDSAKGHSYQDGRCTVCGDENRCGDNLFWEFDADTGTLTIFGTGYMDDFTDGSSMPWYDHLSSITSVVIENGVTKIGNHAFDGCTALADVTIPDSVTLIATQAFYGCTGLKKITFQGGAPSFEYNCFGRVTATAYYPADNATWTEDKLQDYGGTLTWEPYGTKVIASGTCGENLTWLLDEEGVLTISGTGGMYNYTGESIPWYGYKDQIKTVVVGSGVTGIGNCAFQSCDNLTDVFLPESITAIDSYAFRFCSSLTNITIPDGVVRLGLGVFTTCTSLESITIPEGITKIEGSLFECCTSLKSIVIPEGVTSIGIGAFRLCSSLTTIAIPAGVTYIGSQAFMDCTSLDGIWVDPGNPAYYSDSRGVLFDRAQRVLMQAPGTLSGFYTIPAGVTSIDSAFSGCRSLIGVTIPEGVASIGSFAFNECINLLSIKLPGSVTSIDYGAFWYCSQITSFVIPAGVTAIAKRTFVRCMSLKSITIPVSVTSIADEAFSDCFDLTDIYYDGSPAQWAQITIGLDNEYLRNATVHYTNPCASGHAYGADHVCIECGAIGGTCGTDLRWTLDADTGILTISGTGDMAAYTDGGAPWYAYKDSITALNLQEGLTSIGAYACNSCSKVTTVVLPDSVTTIHRCAFAKMTGLTSVTFGKNLAQIGSVKDSKVEESPFYQCASLEEIIFTGATVPTEYGYSLSSMNKGQAIVYVPVEYFRAYAISLETVLQLAKVTSKDATEEFQIREGILEAYFGDDAEVTIPDTVTTIGYGAFNNNSNLTKVILHDGVTVIEDYAFCNVSNLEEVVWPENLTRIGGWSFLHCVGLKELTLSDSVTKIGDYAFSGCLGLTSATFGSGLQSIGYCTFMNCTALSGTLVIPDSVITIYNYAFDSCSNLNGIIFAGNAPTIKLLAFDGVRATVRYPANNETWTEDKLQNYGGTLTWVPYCNIENSITLDAADLAGQTSVWIDGVEYAVQTAGDLCYVVLPDGNARTMITYTYHLGDASDVHSQYPVGMKVWTLENTDGMYAAVRQTDFDDILQYSGSSIRVTGKQGIRMITSIDRTKKSALVSNGLAGYTLKEYGTVVAWADQVADQPLVLGKSYAMSNYAYRKGIADPVFAYEGNLMQYTNVLVGFSKEQCKEDLAMRPYMILMDAAGNEITLYGGIVHRSIGYIAWQNRDVFAAGTEAYEYVWEIIHSVYGDAYDGDYAA